MTQHHIDTRLRQLLVSVKDEGLAPATISSLSAVVIGLSGLEHAKLTPELKKHLHELGALANAIAGKPPAAALS